MSELKEKTKKHAGGRPTKYNAELHPLLAEYLARSGMIDKEIAEKLNINESTLNAWKKHPEFSKSLKNGKDDTDDGVERSLLSRANGYSHPETKFFCSGGVILSKETTKHYPPETIACIFWLKNRRPDKWKDKQIIAGDGEGGAILVKIASDFADDASK